VIVAVILKGAATLVLIGGTLMLHHSMVAHAALIYGAVDRRGGKVEANRTLPEPALRKAVQTVKEAEIGSTLISGLGFTLIVVALWWPYG
jgi:hypothetical protein